MKKLLLIIYFLVVFPCLAQSLKPCPTEVEATLKKAGKNRPELEKAIVYFQKGGDPLKLKAIEFLVANMDIHYSQDYYWADSAGKRIAFNELGYTDWEASVKALDELKAKTKGIHAVSYTYRDIDTIKADFLIENVELAFESWKKSPNKNIPFKDFCEYVLPYRVTTEPLQNWRKVYKERFQWITDSAKTVSFNTLMAYAADDYKSWFTSTWGQEAGNEPLPSLGALQLLFRKRGLCQDIAALEVFTLRSQGIPASFNFIPYWATTANRHFLNTVFDPQMKALQLDVSRSPALDNKLPREPAKVLRYTYSKQPDALSSLIPEIEIPKGFLRIKNYTDISSEYWPVRDVSLNPFHINEKPAITYACVFNGGNWKPIWWGKSGTQSVVFNQLCRGAVFLPCLYKNGRLVVAGNLVAVGYNHQQELIPNTLNKITIPVFEEDRYLIFRPGKKYRLFYWDQSWKFAGEQIALENKHELIFPDVPAGALYRLVPEYSVGMERPFTLLNGERKWW